MEQLLRPLSQWGAIFGLVPFWNLFDVDQTFDCSLFCRPLFWWCVFVFVLQLGQAMAFEVLASIVSVQLAFIPSFLKFTSAVSTVVIFVMNILPRVTFLHYHKLALSVKRLSQFDGIHEEDHKNYWKSIQKMKKQRRRVLILSLIWVLACYALNGPMVILSTSWERGLTFYVVTGYIVLTQVIGFVHIILTFMMFGLGTFAIAERLDTLKDQYLKLPMLGDGMQDNKAFQKVFHVTQDKENPQKLAIERSWVSQLESLKNYFNQLHGGAICLNEAFSTTILVMLLFKLIMCSITLFGIVFIALVPIHMSWIGGVTSGFMFISDLGIILAILTCAESPTKKWQKLLTSVAQSRTTHLGVDGKAEVSLFLEQIRNSSFEFTAGGMFTVGKHLMPGISASIVTYIIVMLQSSLTS